MTTPLSRVSFDTDIRPLFRAIDVAHMLPFNVLLADYAYMSNPAGDHQNARSVHAFLTGARQPRMPIGGPFWTPTQLALYAKWMSDGFEP